jgi:hypothetical protein
MMKAVLTGKKGKFHSAAYLKKQQENFTKLLRDATKVFVERASKRVPVYTGMARSSFRPLGDFVGADVEVNPVTGRKSWADYTRDPASGYASGAFEFMYGPKSYYFIFKSSVFHFKLHEKYSIRGTPQWHSFRVGIFAFTGYLHKNWKSRIVPLKTHIVLNTVRIK